LGKRGLRVGFDLQRVESWAWLGLTLRSWKSANSFRRNRFSANRALRERGNQCDEPAKVQFVRTTGSAGQFGGEVSPFFVGPDKTRQASARRLTLLRSSSHQFLRNLLPMIVKETGMYNLAFIHANHGVVAEMRIEIRIGTAPIVLTKSVTAVDHHVMAGV
jgi:hypothetical protein